MAPPARKVVGGAGLAICLGFGPDTEGAIFMAAVDASIGEQRKPRRCGASVACDEQASDREASGSGL